MTLGKIGKIAIISLPSLGFYRGISDYNYNYKQEQKRKDTNNQPKYYYTNCFVIGLVGIVMYINPFMLPINLFNEAKRVEINIRGLEDEKTYDNYYKLI